MHKKIINKQIIIENYSLKNSTVYENDINKNFLYGEATKKFIKSIKINNKDNIIADIGCGTGFVFELISKKYKNQNINFYGIDPAKGMLKIANNKIKDKRITFKEGSFEKIPLKNNSVDKIISTLALHWATSIDNGLKELKRVLKRKGSIDILMVEKNDGKEFKKLVFRVMKKYLSNKQIFNAAKLINRITKKELTKKFTKYFNLRNDYNLSINIKKKIIYGTCNEHLKWWKARSLQIISEIKNKKLFIKNLKEELNKFTNKKKIPFDLSLLEIHLFKKIN
jgi:ubiquinone/menaquinone biosynthesis C-methylase UbiE